MNLTGSWNKIRKQSWNYILKMEKIEKLNNSFILIMKTCNIAYVAYVVLNQIIIKRLYKRLSACDIEQQCDLCHV